VLELAGRPEVPVAAGAGRPLVREWIRREPSVHGPAGLGTGEIPAPSGSPLAVHAIDFLAGAAEDGPFTLLAVGPLTNVALLLARHPDVAAAIERIVVMGGARTAGNVTTAAEFNVFVDPEAAYRVVSSGLPLMLVDLDLTRRAALTADEADAVRALGERGRLVASLLDYYGPAERGVVLHDAVAVAETIRPELIEKVPARVEVEYAVGPERGRTVVELGAEEPNAEYGVGIDRDAFTALLLERLGRVLS